MSEISVSIKDGVYEVSVKWRCYTKDEYQKFLNTIFKDECYFSFREMVVKVVPNTISTTQNGCLGDEVYIILFKAHPIKENTGEKVHGKILGYLD